MGANPPERSLWQLAAGPISRSYSDTFLKYGVGLIGPGDAGPWKSDRNDKDFEGANFVRSFAQDVNIGDAFLVRSGISSISAIGIVASEYLYLNQFDDVNGWDLQHTRRVRWYKLPEEHKVGGSLFGANPSRFSRIWNEEVIDFVERFLNSPPTLWQTAPLPELPLEEELLEKIPSKFQSLIALADDLFPLYQNPTVFGEPPAEDELIAHFVVPFFRALGWPPEQIAVKWRFIDLAIFKALPRLPANCQFVIEAKRMEVGAEGALNQAKGYVDALGFPLDIILTDGIRYRMYSCRENYEPIAYANLARLKKSALVLFGKLERPLKEANDVGPLV